MKLEIYISFSQSNKQPQSFSGVQQQQFRVRWCSTRAADLARLHWTPHSSARLRSTLSLHSWAEGTAPGWSMLFSWQKAEVQEVKPIYDSTFKSSAQTRSCISSSRILLAKENHLANPNGRWRSGLCLWEGTGSHLAKNVDA